MFSVHSGGVLFTLENPASSLIWHHPRMVELLRVCHVVTFDQCMFGLYPPHMPRGPKLIKKPTTLVTNADFLSPLAVRCSHQHSHFACLGSVLVNGRRVKVSEHAGRYPRKLCDAWARLFAQHGLQRGGEGGEEVALQSPRRALGVVGGSGHPRARAR